MTELSETVSETAFTYDPSKYLTARQYAEMHLKSKVWILRLLAAGRLPGAYKAGSVWLIPMDTPLPKSLMRGARIKHDPEAARRAMEAARAGAAAEALTERQMRIAAVVAAGGTFEEDGAEFSHLYDFVRRWPDWTDEDWRFYVQRSETHG